MKTNLPPTPPAPLAAVVENLPGGPVDRTGRYVLVASSWNASIMEPLIQGAIETLQEAGVEPGNILLVRVPGAFEIPQAVQAVLNTVTDATAVVTLGCVIRGETPHFEFVAGECARGIAAIARHSDIPVVLGVLTTDSLAQAQARCVPGEHNKGREAAAAALDLQQVIARLKDRRES